VQIWEKFVRVDVASCFFSLEYSSKGKFPLLWQEVVDSASRSATGKLSWRCSWSHKKTTNHGLWSAPSFSFKYPPCVLMLLKTNLLRGDLTSGSDEIRVSGLWKCGQFTECGMSRLTLLVLTFCERLNPFLHHEIWIYSVDRRGGISLFLEARFGLNHQWSVFINYVGATATPWSWLVIVIPGRPRDLIFSSIRRRNANRSHAQSL